jgi:uncharacterized coiled-coil DUF342 family protein
LSRYNVTLEDVKDAREIYGVDVVGLFEAHWRQFGSENEPKITIERLQENGEHVGTRIEVRKAVTKSNILLEKWRGIDEGLRSISERIKSRVASGDAYQEEMETYRRIATEIKAELDAYVDRLDEEDFVSRHAEACNECEGA